MLTHSNKTPLANTAHTYDTGIKNNTRAGKRTKGVKSSERQRKSSERRMKEGETRHNAKPIQGRHRLCANANCL